MTVAVGATGAGSETMVMDAATQEEIERLDGAVDAFAAEMKARLREQALKGYRGWDDPAQYECIGYRGGAVDAGMGLPEARDAAVRRWNRSAVVTPA